MLNISRRQFGQETPVIKKMRHELPDDDQEEELEDDDLEDNQDELEGDDNDQDADDEIIGLEPDDDDSDRLEDSESDSEEDSDIENTAVKKKSKRDLLVMKEVLREPIIDEGKYLAVVENVQGEEKMGEYGKYTLISISLKVKKSDKGSVTIPLRAAMSLSPESRLFRIVKSILGRKPQEGTDLRQLIGRQVRVEIEHREDAKGNVWEDIVDLYSVG